ncbi:hypothetical protein [Oceaniglobus trochenteri]|uniref:hypothetical protein n=1 Tax=Oceaniglobus trochenteri TaxID=2763260 RepID=UPI001CFF8F89|nr:hypothetical protein [Oceaniglobus trochenteri]
MASYDNFHSRLVAWLKVVLPLVALAILSTLFLVSRKADPERAIPYSEVEVAAILREQRIESPDYSGMTRDGTAITMAAESARPDTAERVTARTLRARVETPDGGILAMTAGSGVIDTAAQRADMEGGVRIETSTGYVIDTAGLSAALDATDVETTGAITARGPMGDLEAGQMALRQGDGGEGPAYVLVFKGGVHLIYRPQPTQGGGQ